MNLNTTRAAQSAALSFGLLWITCSGMVMLAPALMMQMTGHLLHADLSNFHWTMTLSGFLIGFFSWMILAGVTAALFATIYNWLDNANQDK